MDENKFYIENEVSNSDSFDERRFFDRYYRGENSSKVKGKGLGLTIVKELVKVHGWKIEAKKLEGKVRMVVRF